MNITTTERYKAGFIKKIFNRIRYGLVLQVIRNRLAAIGFDFLLYYLFRENMDDIKLPDIDGNISDYKVEFLQAEDMKIIGYDNPGFTTEKFLEHLSLGRKCIGVRYKDDIISFVWFDFEECNFKPYKFKLKSNEVYCYNLFTFEPYRGKNIAPWLKYRSYEMLREMGIDTSYSIIEYVNSSSLRYAKKLKFTKMKLGLYIKLFKKYEWNITLMTYN